MAACQPEVESAQLVEAEYLFAARSAAVVSMWLVVRELREIYERALRPFPPTREELAEEFAA